MQTSMNHNARRRMLTAMCLSFAAVLSLADTVEAALIVSWDTTGNAGTEASEAVAASDPLITGLPITRSAGLVGNAGGNSLNANSWNTAATADPKDDTEYFQLGFTIPVGYQVSLTKLRMASQVSGTGPGSMGVYYSLDGFATTPTLLSTITGYTAATLKSSDIDFSSLGVIAAPVSAITLTVRFIQIGNVAQNGGATAAAGTWRIAEFVTAVGPPAVTENINFDGSISLIPLPPSAVPLPGSALVFMLGATLVGAARKKIKAALC
jgi:hypothetical protein